RADRGKLCTSRLMLRKPMTNHTAAAIAPRSTTPAATQYPAGPGRGGGGWDGLGELVASPGVDILVALPARRGLFRATSAPALRAVMGPEPGQSGPDRLFGGAQ